MSQPHKNAFGLDLLLRVTFLLKRKKKNQSYNQGSFGISVDTNKAVECGTILIQILCGTFYLVLWQDVLFDFPQVQ